MAFPSLTWIGQLPEIVRRELDQVLALLEGFLSAEHNEDGSHGAVTATSLTLATDSTSDETWAGNVGASLVPSVAGVDLGATVTRDNVGVADLPFRNVRFYGTLTYSEGFSAYSTSLGGNRFTLTHNGTEWAWTFGTNNVSGVPLVLRLRDGGNTHTLTVGAGLVGLISDRAITGASLNTAGTITGNYLEITDGVTAPGAGAGARIYVDTADGDLKVVFADGTVKTIVTDT